MANKPYDNFVLKNEIKDQYISKLDHSMFTTVDTSLKGEAGMEVHINRYFGHVGDDKDASGAEVVAEGVGNSKLIEMGFEPKKYVILTTQAHGEWLDEQEKKDPLVPMIIAGKIATDLFNSANSEVVAEYEKGTLTQAVVGTDFFGAFVDAQAQMNIESVEQGLGTFALVSVKDMAKIRKGLKDDLKYVESFARQGYVGTVAGTNIYVDKAVAEGKIYLATKQAVTTFIKDDITTELLTEGNRDKEMANKRQNSLFGRDYHVIALTDNTKVVKITIG